MSPVIVQRVEDLPDLKAWKAPVVIDTETSGLSPHHGHRICGISVCSANDLDRAFYVPVRHAMVSFGEQGWESKPPDDYRNLGELDVFAWVARFASDPKMTWIMHNAVFDLGMFRIEGVEFAGQIWDTMVMAHGYNSGRGSYALDALTPGEHPWYLKLKAELARGQTFPGVGEGVKAQANYSWLPISLLGPYACEDVVSTGRLFQRMRERKDKLLAAPDNFGNPSHSQVEMLQADQELVRVLFEMQWAGVRVDLKAVLDARRDAEALAGRAMEIMLSCSGGAEFNPASGDERSEAFIRAGGKIRFWMLPKDERGKQKVDHFTQDKAKSTEKPCWNAVAILKYLEEYEGQHENPAYRFLVAYRRHSQLTRLISTYLDAYLHVTDPNGILHGNFHPTGTRTGRLSSRHPNLQNVTKTEDNVDTKALEEHMDEDLLQESDAFAEAKALPYYRSGAPNVQSRAKKTLAQRMRSFFVARPGRVIVSIDYSSVEYRVAAYLTGDPKLIGAYKQNPKLDFHQYCADLIGISRSHAKTCVTGDSLVKTGQGLQRIDEIVEHKPGRHALSGQSVYCEDGKVREAVSGIAIGEKEVLELTTEWGIKLKLTPDHECMAVRDGNIVRVRADRLKQGDNVIMQHGAECHGNTREVPSLRREMRRARTSYKALKITELTPEFCAWLGHFVAEGHRRSDRTNRYSVGSAIDLKQDADVLVYLKDLHANLFKGRAKVHTYAGVVQFRISSKDLYYLLEEMGVGHNSGSQVIPFCVRSASFEYKRAFFRTYFEGDGTVTGSGVSCTSKSEELIRQIQAEMLNIGIVGTVDAERRKDYGFFWSWRVANREMLRRFEERIGFIGKRKRDRLSAILISDAQQERSCLFYDGFEKCYPGMMKQLHGLARDKVCECRRAGVRLGDTRLREIPAEFWSASLTRMVQAGLSTVKVRSVKKCRKKELVYDIYEPVKTSMVCNGLLVADCNFGILYGMGDGSLASMLRVPLSEAQSIRARLYAKVPAMKRLINDLKEVGRREGHIQNPMGRVVAVSPDRTYTALNYLDQGLCGDIMRRALVRVWRLIQERRWDILMMLTVHDEIVLDMPPVLVAVAAPEIAKAMCDVPEVGLPLICDIEVGTNWGELASLESWLRGGAA